MPDGLDSLNDERYSAYGSPQGEPASGADGSLEVSEDVISVCEMEILAI